LQNEVNLVQFGVVDFKYHKPDDENKAVAGIKRRKNQSQI